MEEIFVIQDELKKVPGKPGVYIMRDKNDGILYVGKAINLRNRLRSYFRANIGRGPWIDKMVGLIHHFEYIVTDSELEALVLENNLIKEHRPKYNTMLVDDKTYPYIKVTVSEEYPRILFSREMKKDKAKYFGPYTSAAAVKDTIELINRLYQLRTCNRVLPRDIGNDRPCLNYHIHQCLAPCQGYVSKEEYQKQVDEALDFLNGNYNKILKSLEENMKQAAENMEFEEAAKYRDLHASVKQVAQKQKMTDSEGEDKDIIALALQDDDAVIQVFFVRDGRLIGREHFYMRCVEGQSRSEILSSFINESFDGFRISNMEDLKVYSFLPVDKNIPTLNFIKEQEITNPLGLYLSELGITQARIAETEKFPHVTYFFDGGYNGRIAKCNAFHIPSPSVPTYDLKPEMSAVSVTKKCIECMVQDYDFILMNFANPDMVGHTGDYEATIKACMTIDLCLGKIIEKAEENFYKVIILADHGNADIMLDEDGTVLTTHTLSKVPFVILDKNIELEPVGDLTMVAPTILEYMDIAIPEEMKETEILLK